MQNVKENNKYEILTPFGWEDFLGVIKNTGIKRDSVILITESLLKIHCTSDHKIMINKMEFTPAGELEIGDSIVTKNGIEKIISITKSIMTEIYDIFNSESHTIYANMIGLSNCDEFS